MTRALLRALSAVLLVAPLLAGPACAQRHHRTRLWAEFPTGGLGSARVACSGCTEVTTGAGVGTIFRMGGAVSERAFLGGEGFSFTDRSFGFTPGDTSVAAETSTLMLVVLWFPWRSGVFFKGGVGASSGDYIVSSSPVQADTAHGDGIAMTLGLGFDLPISRKFAITANVAAFITAMGDVVLPLRRVDDVIATIYHLGIGLTWR